MSVHNLFLYDVNELLHVTSFLGTSVFLYVGPDQILPLASFVGAAIGVILIVWHRVTAFLRKVVQFFNKKENAAK